MKRLLLLVLISVSGFASGQFVNPHATWSFETRQLKPDEFELVFTVKLADKFHLYSQDIEEGGPIPTSFTFEPSKSYKLIGKVQERSKRHEAFEPLFEMNVIWFEGTAEFVQKVKLKSDEATVKGIINFMTCDDKMCDPPTDQAFEFHLKGKVSVASPDTSAVEAAVPVPVDSGTAAVVDQDTASVQVATMTASPAEDADDVRGKTYWNTFLAGLGTGLLALFFPCVWPVIPLTVSFFLKQNHNPRQGRLNAGLYGLSIMVVFVILGVLVSLLTNSQKLNELSTGWFFNMLFFVLFFIFGLSFLGVFEIRLPSALINRSESLSEKGGLLGIFFMAFTLVLVSFSCTLPFVANLISIVTDEGEFIKPLIGFAAFGLALGLPFGLFAWFPTALKRLPRSGHWMHVLKVTFGLLEIALSLIYLSKVDMAYHWGILSRDIFLALWIIIFGVLGLYLLGKIKISADDDDSHISVPRLLSAIVCLSFVVYMIPGLWGSPLKPLSGFLPNYSEFNVFIPESESVNNSQAKETESLPRKYSHLFEAPLGLDVHFDYDEALNESRKQSKPLFIDFTGWGCVNCRKMEKSVWPDSKVLSRLKNDFVVASLYVDDRTPLPEAEQYYSEALKKKVKTLGDRNFDIQYSRFRMGAQPYYVLLDEEGNLLTSPRGYTPDVEEYVAFLDSGIEEFRKRN